MVVRAPTTMVCPVSKMPTPEQRELETKEKKPAKQSTMKKRQTSELKRPRDDEGRDPRGLQIGLRSYRHIRSYLDHLLWNHDYSYTYRHVNTICTYTDLLSFTCSEAMCPKGPADSQTQTPIKKRSITMYTKPTAKDVSSTCQAMTKGYMRYDICS